MSRSLDAIKVDILEHDFGDSFETGQEVIEMLDRNEFFRAIGRMTSCVRLHETCGNYIKAGLILDLIDDLLAWRIDVLATAPAKL